MKIFISNQRSTIAMLFVQYNNDNYYYDNWMLLCENLFNYECYQFEILYFSWNILFSNKFYIIFLHKCNAIIELIFMQKLNKNSTYLLWSFPPTSCSVNRKLFSLWKHLHVPHSFHVNISRISCLKLYHAMHSTINIGRLNLRKDFTTFWFQTFFTII